MVYFIKVLIDFFSGSSNSLTSTTALTLNGWTHLVMTRSKTNGVKFYLDGGESGTSTYTGNASSLSQRDTIGSYWDGTRMSFDGKIDQVRIYSTALDSNQVADLYNEKPELAEDFLTQYSQGRAIKAEKAAKDLFYQLLTKYAEGGPRAQVSPFWLDIIRKDRK